MSQRESACSRKQIDAKSSVRMQPARNAVASESSDDTPREVLSDRGMAASR